MIRDVNKRKRFEWAQQHIDEASTGFEDLIWSNEATVQLELHRHFCCRKRGERQATVSEEVCLCEYDILSVPPPTHTHMYAHTHTHAKVSCQGCHDSR